MYYKKKPNLPDDYKKFHHCDVPGVYFLYGQAIDECQEDADGFLFVSNGEYGSQVNFCPICGYEAKRKIQDN